MVKIIKGKKMAYKGFDVDENNNLYCRNMKYEVGKTASVKGDLEICENGLHFCWDINNVHGYYSLLDKVICEVEILGDILNAPDMEKSCTNKLKVVRILTKEDVLKLSNAGQDNSGIANSGDRNSGNWNSGDRNSGNWNSGYMNSGDRNSGNRNSGYMNSGNRNSGYMNSGDRNSGYMNSGYMNSGYMNSGYMNSGYMNSGDWNSGVFCTQVPQALFFDIQTSMTMSDFLKSKYWDAMTNAPFKLTEWMEYTVEEKENDKAKELIGGYLKKRTYKKACELWWGELSDDDRETIKFIPNFDASKFKDITGIEVES